MCVTLPLTFPVRQATLLQNREQALLYVSCDEGALYYCTRTMAKPLAVGPCTGLIRIEVHYACHLAPLHCTVDEQPTRPCKHVLEGTMCGAIAVSIDVCGNVWY